MHRTLTHVHVFAQVKASAILGSLIDASGSGVGPELVQAAVGAPPIDVKVEPAAAPARPLTLLRTSMQNTDLAVAMSVLIACV